MKLRVAAFTVAGALALAPMVFAGDGDQVTNNVPTQRLPIMRVTLSELFAKVAAQNGEKLATNARNVVLYENPATEVIMVRRNDDGSVSRACVETEKAARTFFAGRKNNNTKTNDQDQ